MAGKSKARRGAGFFIMLYLILLLFVFIPVVSTMVTAVNGVSRYGVTYDKDPLILRSVEVVNRGTSYGEYRISEGNTLCEIVITYENVGWYVSEYSDRPEFYGLSEDGAEEYLGQAWCASEAELVYEATGDNPIPAGKTGCRRYFVELWPGMTELIIRENGDKLEGDLAEVVLQIPEGQWVSCKTTVYGEQ